MTTQPTITTVSAWIASRNADADNEHARTDAFIHALCRIRRIHNEHLKLALYKRLHDAVGRATNNMQQQIELCKAFANEADMAVEDEHGN